MQLTPHFSLAEATRTDTGLDNNPDSDEDLATLQRTAMKMELVRAVLGCPIIISSWYRSFAVNRKVGGVADSQHKLGEAVDFIAPGYGDPYAICQLLSKHKVDLDFDQLIHEPSWVHISWNTSRVHRSKLNRNQLLTRIGPNQYANGILPEAK